MAKAAVKKTAVKKPAAKKPAARSVGSLLQLLKQINEGAPKRSKVSDGWVGDAKHAARHSDHNAEPDGTVDARDFTNDPSGGMDSQKLCDALVASRDPRISYIICNGKIISGRKGPKPWVARKYTGSNSHHMHIHVSVLDEGQDDRTPWKIESAFKKSPAENLTVKEVNSVLKLGSKGEPVKNLQHNLNKLGYGPLDPDGYYGDGTEAAVKQFQEAMKLRVDGWAGPVTIEHIGKEIAKLKLKPKLAEAEAKVEESKVIVDQVANNGKVSIIEWMAGITGAGGAMSVAKQAADTVTETTESVGQLAVSLGPWIILGVVCAAAAGYIIYTRRNARLEATAIKKVL
jgi:peptidoglycan hydrolase-like protein with peptidoglycan-binding domain